MTTGIGAKTAQYPRIVYQWTGSKPASDLCEQCKAKEANGECQTAELSATQEGLLVRDIPVFC